MVVLAIIIVIMSIVFSSQSTFNKSLILSNTAYDIALTLRSAQTYGLGSRATASNIKNAGYGIHVAGIPSGSFILFADTSPSSSAASACHPNPDSSAPNAQPGNCVYDSGEQVMTYTLGNNITISDFCAYKTATGWSCASSGNISSLDIVFARPNPDPFMSVNGSYSAVSAITAACFTVTSPQGGTKFISVAASGEITANAVSCP